MSLISRKLRLERNILLSIAVLLITSNCLLSFKLIKQEVTTRNLPITEQELIISNNFVNNAALKLRADQILNLLFSMKKENVARVTAHLLMQVDNEFYPEIKQQIEILSEDIKQRGYRYIFSDILAYEYDNYNFSVKVKGHLETYLADKRINTQMKEYLLQFSNSSGIINLKSFEEIKDTKEIKPINKNEDNNEQ